MGRKVIQMAAAANDISTSDSVYALCDDGTMWLGYWGKGGFQWSEIPDVPQGDSATTKGGEDDTN